MARVSVVIPTWNGLTHLQQCLPALMAQEEVDFEVVVVDNGSSDGTTDYLDRCYPTIHVIRNKRNLGFAAANNAAMRATRTEFVATLNNDTLPRPRWLSSLVKAADAHADYGAFASKMCFWQQPHVINSAGLVVDRAGLAWDRHCGDPVEEASAKAEVFGASAGAALYRRKLLDDIGLFDERFFAYLEDVDLAWRAQWRDGALYTSRRRRCFTRIRARLRQDRPSSCAFWAETRSGFSRRITLGPVYCGTFRRLCSLT